MVALIQEESLDFADALPAAARAAIRQLLERDPRGTRKVYAALAHKVWSLLIDRRLDDELRDWHALLTGVRAKIRSGDGAAAERMTALADLLRESISLADVSPARTMAARPQARRILDHLLAAARSGYVPRRELLDTLDIGGSHLSNLLTQLAAQNLVERRGNGKEAEFRLTEFGRQILKGISHGTAAVHAGLAQALVALSEPKSFPLLPIGKAQQPPVEWEFSQLAWAAARDGKVGIVFETVNSARANDDGDGYRPTNANIHWQRAGLVGAAA